MAKIQLLVVKAITPKQVTTGVKPIIPCLSNLVNELLLSAILEMSQ